jgi:hypothetical protein
MYKQLLFILFLIITNNNYAQKHGLYEYERLTKSLLNKYYDAISTEDLWRPYVNELNDIIEDMENDLKSGSGLDFNEMNELRKLKAALRKMKDFGYGVAAGSNIKMFNGRMVREIKEVFPNIITELVTENSCISFYRITFFNYVCIVARHNERGTVKEINWRDNSGKCGSISFEGTFTVQPGVYFTFWKNAKCPFFLSNVSCKGRCIQYSVTSLNATSSARDVAVK